MRDRTLKPCPVAGCGARVISLGQHARWRHKGAAAAKAAPPARRLIVVDELLNSKPTVDVLRQQAAARRERAAIDLEVAGRLEAMADEAATFRS